MEAIIGAGAPAAGDANLVKNGTTATFMADVIDASHDAAVVVDFWAPWCGPCKQLGPQLEKAVRDAKGAVRMVKINIDENQELAQQMRIQSIPAVYAFRDGRPVDGFVGAVPESQIKQFVGKLASEAGPGASPILEAVALAKEALAAGDAPRAANIFAQVIQHDPENVDAMAGLARIALAKKDLDQVRAILAKVPADQAKHADIVALRAGLELAEAGAKAEGELGALKARLEADAGDHQARLDLASALFAAGEREAAIDQLLELIRRDREWDEQAGRKQLVKLFEAIGLMDPLTVQSRKQLSSILFFMSVEPHFDDLPAALPVFPLTGVLLLPRGRLPLNIFEPRYLAMTEYALGAGRMIGMVQPQEGKVDAGDPAVYPIGCAGRIVEFSETPDGRFLLTLKGIARFEIASEPPRQTLFRQIVPDWRRFRGDLAEDEKGVDRAHLIAAIGPFFERQGVGADTEVLNSAPLEQLVNSLAMACPFSPREKQALLEAPSTAERAKILIALVEMSVASTVGSGGATRN